MADTPYPCEKLDQNRIKEQRLHFLSLLEEMGRKNTAIELKFNGPGVAGLRAQGRTLAVESSLEEILVENLETPTGTVSTARVDLSDVLYVKLLDDATSN